MMTPEWLAASARYNHWMNDKLYALASTLSDEARRRDSGAFFKSIHGTFNHILVVDRLWLGRFHGEAVQDGFMGPRGIRSLDQELFSDFAELGQERARTDDELAAWVAGLAPEQLAAPLTYQRYGQRMETPLWWAVAQVFNHQTHHRGQLTTLFLQQHCDAGVTDLFAMLREEEAVAASALSPRAVVG